jgi:hypothetical protein
MSDRGIFMDFPTFLEALEHWNPSSIHQVEASSWAYARTDAISAREPIVILLTQIRLKYAEIVARCDPCFMKYMKWIVIKCNQ